MDNQQEPKKPPVGLRPTFIWLEERKKEIEKAIIRRSVYERDEVLDGHNMSETLAGYMGELNWIKELIQKENERRGPVEDGQKKLFKEEE